MRRCIFRLINFPVSTMLCRLHCLSHYCLHSHRICGPLFYKFRGTLAMVLTTLTSGFRSSMKFLKIGGNRGEIPRSEGKVAQNHQMKKFSKRSGIWRKHIVECICVFVRTVCVCVFVWLCVCRWNRPETCTLSSSRSVDRSWKSACRLTPDDFLQKNSTGYRYPVDRNVSFGNLEN